MYLRQCFICGENFTANSMKAKYCSDECRRIVKNEIYMPKVVKKAKIAKTQPNSTMPELERIANEASRLDLSYGEYVAGIRKK